MKNWLFTFGLMIGLALTVWIVSDSQRLTDFDQESHDHQAADTDGIVEHDQHSPGQQQSSVESADHDSTVQIDSEHGHSHEHAHEKIDQEQLESLIDKHISDEMRAAINEALRPGNQPPQVIELDGHLVLDTSDRAATVMVGIIDDDDNLVVTDFTQPLPEKTGDQ